MATEKQRLHNNLASLRGVDKFIDFLLLHVDKTTKIQGTLFVAEYIVKLCKDRKTYNKKFREETLEKIKEIKEDGFFHIVIDIKTDLINQFLVLVNISIGSFIFT